MHKFGVIILLLFIANTVVGETKGTGKITGLIVEKGNDTPVEYASIQLLKITDHSPVEGTTSDPKGNFSISNVAFGEYSLAISFMGFEKLELPNIRLTKEQSTVNLGRILLEASTIAVEEVTVQGKRSTYKQTIDKKVFNVGTDLTSSSGSVSDLMQNVPSLQVDMEGNVSLRGSENVQILINGKPSALMGKNRAEVLQQLPANSVERIEVITNPSAKYKPDGTSGIINLILKKDRKDGFNGTFTANTGNKERYNSSLAVNYHTGKINLFGSYGIRLDRRDRYSKDDRIKTDSLTGEKSDLYQTIDSKARPTSHIAQTGIEWQMNDRNSLEASVNYTHMKFIRKENTLTNSTDNNQLLISNYNRNRYDDEYHQEVEMAAKYSRKIGDDQELSVDYTHNSSKEQEDNHFTNQYLVPVKPDSKDNTLIWQANYENLLRVNYLCPLSGKDAELELGYELEANQSDLNFKAEDLIGSTWTPDKARSNRFIFDETVHSFYATDKQTFGKFGMMAGLRAEQSIISSHLVTLDSLVNNNYFSIYPTLHTSFNFTDNSQWQLNYSKRINRPEGDDLNPFPEYRDHYNISAGNPKLKPEQIHSIETGILYHQGANTYSATLYYRYAYNKMTEITRFVNDSVLLTTKENLASSSSTGVEGIINRSLGKFGNVNLNFNGYLNKLDASNLGYSTSKTAFSWNTSLNTNFTITKLLMAQVNMRYASAVLTPQGERQPTFIVNTGARYDVFKRKASLMLTVSDLFDTFRNRTIIDTPELHREIESRRAPRIFYVGFTYHFGSTDKKGKETQLKYED